MTYLYVGLVAYCTIVAIGAASLGDGVTAVMSAWVAGWIAGLLYASPRPQHSSPTEGK